MPEPTIQRSFYESTSDHGLWSPSTSTANFCEEDYVVSHYIGEFVNSLTNVAYIYYALYPPTILRTSQARSMQHSSGPAYQQGRISRSVVWDVQTVALILVGISSGLFHMTLHAWPQWLDESSMYLLAASWIHALLTTTYIDISSHKQKQALPGQRYQLKRHNEVVVGAFIALVIALASMSTVWTGNLAIHSIMFAVLLVVSGLKLIYQIFVSTIAARDADTTPSSSSIASMARARSLLLTSLIKAICFLVVAFALWLLDSNPAVCTYLRYLRKDVFGQLWYLRPLGFLTELHGWWHILTAKAAAEYIALIRVLTKGPSI